MELKNNVVVLTSVAASNIDSLNRVFIADKDIQNGTVFARDAFSTNTGESEVFTIKDATPTDTGLYMAFSPEDTIVVIGGQKYKYGHLDPRLFTNIAGMTFSGFRLTQGDRITISADAIKGEAVSGINYVGVNDDGELEYTDTKPTGLAFEALKNDYLMVPGVGNGMFGASHRLAAVQLEVINN